MTNVVDIPMVSHEDVSELLPDYATGALDENESRLVEDHLVGCDDCRLELADLLETTSVIVNAGSPRPEVRRALMARVESAPGQAPRPLLASVPAQMHAPRGFGRHRLSAVAWVTAALFVVAILALGGWNYLLQQNLEDRDRIARLITGEDTAHALTDSGFDTGATGVMYVDPDSNQALLVASGLTPLPSDRGYQIWLFTEDGQQVSAGVFPIDASGFGQGLVTAPEPLREYHAVALSAEPVTGSGAPTAPLSLGGWLQ